MCADVGFVGSPGSTVEPQGCWGWEFWFLGRDSGGEASRVGRCTPNRAETQTPGCNARARRSHLRQIVDVLYDGHHFLIPLRGQGVGGSNLCLAVCHHRQWARTSETPEFRFSLHLDTTSHALATPSTTKLTCRAMEPCLSAINIPLFQC